MELSSKQKEHLRRQASHVFYERTPPALNALANNCLGMAGLKDKDDKEFMYYCRKGWVRGVSIYRVEMRDHMVLIMIGKVDEDAVEDRRRLEVLMREEGFGNGVLQYPLTTIFFTLDTKDEDAKMQEKVTVDNFDHYEEVVRLMAQIAAPYEHLHEVYRAMRIRGE